MKDQFRFRRGISRDCTAVSSYYSGGLASVSGTKSHHLLFIIDEEDCKNPGGNEGCCVYSSIKVRGRRKRTL